MYLSEMEFTKRKQFGPLFRNMKQVIAKYYTDGDMSQATILLEGQKNQIARFDLFVISFLMGLNIAIIAMMILYIHYFMDYKEISEEKKGIFWRAIQLTNPVMRFCFILCYILFASGCCITVFRKYQINYLHIF